MDHQASAVQVIKLKPDRLQLNLSVNKHNNWVNIYKNMDGAKFSNDFILYTKEPKKTTFSA